MTDPHPEARTLAEALAHVDRRLKTWSLTGDKARVGINLGHLRTLRAALASHPPAEPGWTEQESGLERVLTNLVRQFPSDEKPDDRVAGTLTFSEVCELRQFVRERPRMRFAARWREHFAERASGEEGGA